MSAISVWIELTRLEQRLIIKLFAGGSFRGQQRETIEGLLDRGLIDNHGLTNAGRAAFEAAFHAQQAIRAAA